MKCSDTLAALALAAFQLAAQPTPPNRWVEVRRDAAGARRGSAIRYAPDADAFFLWGFFDYDRNLPQEQPLMETPEYDMVAFDPERRVWSNVFPARREREYARKLPLAYIPRTYAAITTGSERTVLRGTTGDAEGAPRPDLNIVFDQVAYDPEMRALIYFTGGLTAAYRIAERRWTDLMPMHSPPPVLGGSLEFDPVNRELVLFGGGFVAERDAAGRSVGYTGTWVLSGGDWRRLPAQIQPPPRMNSRMVCDPKNQVIVLFGGDGQSHYLADTWLYDLKSRTWRKSRAAAGPAARAGHFTVYDPETGWVLAGGGYNTRDLTDMWAYDAAQDRWLKLPGEVPVGFYISADIAPKRRTIVLVTNTRAPADRMSCNVLYPVRTTYEFRIDPEALQRAATPAAAAEQPIAKRVVGPAREAREQLDSLPSNQWLRLETAGRAAPVRTWGSATYDPDRRQILYWGGGHCGYGGSDVDAYDVEANTWRAAEGAPEFPHRAWDHGVRLAGITFEGKPWTDHGRRIYAYDPVSRRMVMARTIRLAAGYDPELLRGYPEKRAAAEDAVAAPSSYVRYATFLYDPQTGNWSLAGPAPAGVDTLVSTPHGVMGVNVDWPARLNDAGYQMPWRAGRNVVDTALYLFSAARRRWMRLDRGQPSPQNLYEMTSLAYDTKRDRLVLHGGGAKRDELWTFDYSSRHWAHMQPKGDAPPCAREAVYLPRQDLFVTLGAGRDAAVWSWSPAHNEWRRMPVNAPVTGQNRALVYDPKRELLLLVTGSSDSSEAAVYAMKLSGN
jgi:Galactose oxidase, central domain